MFSMNEVKIAIIIILFLGSFCGLKAQTYDELLKRTDSGKDISERLPPLSELQEKAIANSPTIKYFDLEVDLRNIQIKTEKREWMKNLGVETGAKYGLFDNLVLTQDLGYNDIATTTTEQTRYYLGAYLKFPLSTFADKTNVQAAKVEANKAKMQQLQNINNLRQMVIVQYNNVIRAHRNLIIRLDAVEIYRIQKMRAETDFSNNQINVAELARLTDMLSKAVSAVEDSKIEFQTAIQVLEEMVGEKINLKN